MLGISKWLWFATTAVMAMACDYNQFTPVEKEKESDGQAKNYTIAELKALYVEGGVEIFSDVVIAGRIISSDACNNFYQSLIVEDATGAIEIKIGIRDYNNYYKTTQSVSVKAKGLTLGCDKGMYQLGIRSSDSRYEVASIPTKQLVDKYIFNVKTHAQEVLPTTLRISNLSQAYIGKLIRIEDLEADRLAWERWAKSAIWSPTGYPQTQNTPIYDRSFNRAYVTTSGYASFADTEIPMSRITVTGILQKINMNDYAIQMRSLDDLEVL